MRLAARVAALYDIHGNLPALESVLKDLQHLATDQVVVGGDVLSGPLQNECLAALRALTVPVHYLTGNSDREVLSALRKRENNKLPSNAREMLRWSARNLEPEYEEWIASWPTTVTIEISNLGTVLFCHATPRNDNEIFTSTTNEALLLPIFDRVGADVVVCGHTHMQFDRMVGKTRVINAGSVGMPFGPRGADWLFLGPRVDLRHTDYDYGSARRRIAETGFPNPPEFDIMSPPTADQMLKLYSNAELKN